MRVSIALLAATILAAHDVPASATVRISSDPGGRIGSYLDKLQSLRSSGESVVIDGPCLSACTMVLGMIPRDRICRHVAGEIGLPCGLASRSGRSSNLRPGRKRAFDEHVSATGTGLDQSPGRPLTAFDLSQRRRACFHVSKLQR